MSTKYALLFIIGVSCHSIAYAQHHSARPSHSATINSTVDDSSYKAKQWGLTSEEWQRYQQLMDGPLGIYSPNIDPLTALGISANSENERQRYAKLQVIAEIQRVERELAYQRTYDAAFKQLYPNLLPVDFGISSSKTNRSPSVTESRSDRLAVFVKEHCKPCEAKVKQLQKAGIGFDIYMVDSNQDDAMIRKWATRIGINPNKVFAQEITLNHDAGRWQALALTGELPAVVKEVNGQWQRQ